MTNTFRASAVGALATLALTVGAPAFADSVVFQTAGFVPNGETGDYSIYGDGGPAFVATTFTLTQQTQVTGIGGVFTVDGDGGSIFGEIIAAPNSQSNLTSASLTSSGIAHTTFNAPTDGSDTKVALSALLGPGTYELVFGSGLWGATGTSGLASGMNGSANFFKTIDGGASGWDANTDSVRMTVYASPVPLPAGLPLLLSGIAAFGALRRRQQKAA